MHLLGRVLRHPGGKGSRTDITYAFCGIPKLVHSALGDAANMQLPVEGVPGGVSANREQLGRRGRGYPGIQQARVTGTGLQALLPRVRQVSLLAISRVYL